MNDALDDALDDELRRLFGSAGLALVPPPELGRDILRGAARRHRRILATRSLAGAVGLAALVAVGLALRVPTGRQTLRAVQPSATVIPWLDAPAQPPAPIPPPVPPPPRYPACTAGELRAGAGGTSAAAGTVAVGVRLTNIGTSPCSLSGYPTSLAAVYPNGARQVLHPVLGTIFGAATAWPANLIPGAVAHLTIAAPDGCYMPSGVRVLASAVIGLPGGGTLTAPVTFTTGCGLAVSTFGDPAPPQVSGTYPGLTVSTTFDVTGATTSLADVTAGSTAYYTVTLTNTTSQAITFPACPVYQEVIFPLDGGSPSGGYYRLNCAPARTLPAGGEATFAMQIAVPPVGGMAKAKFDWSIPNSANAFGPALILITPSTARPAVSPPAVGTTDACPNQVHGITQGHQPPVPGFYVSNSWTGRTGATDFAVFAGGPYGSTNVAQPSTVGELVVIDTGADCSAARGKSWYVTDRAVPGPFTITAASGAQLIVTGANGATFTYFVAGRSQQPGVTTSNGASQG